MLKKPFLGSERNSGWLVTLTCLKVMSDNAAMLFRGFTMFAFYLCST